MRNPVCSAPTPGLSRTVHIVDADSFTREFVAARGVQLAPAQPFPVNPIQELLAAKSKPSGQYRLHKELNHSLHPRQRLLSMTLPIV